MKDDEFIERFKRDEELTLRGAVILGIALAIIAILAFMIGG